MSKITILFLAVIIFALSGCDYVYTPLSATEAKPFEVEYSIGIEKSTEDILAEVGIFDALGNRIYDETLINPSTEEVHAELERAYDFLARYKEQIAAAEGI